MRLLPYMHAFGLTHMNLHVCVFFGSARDFVQAFCHFLRIRGDQGGVIRIPKNCYSQVVAQGSACGVGVMNYARFYAIDYTSYLLDRYGPTTPGP